MGPCAFLLSPVINMSLVGNIVSCIRNQCQN